MENGEQLRFHLFSPFSLFFSSSVKTHIHYSTKPGSTLKERVELVCLESMECATYQAVRLAQLVPLSQPCWVLKRAFSNAYRSTILKGMLQNLCPRGRRSLIFELLLGYVRQIHHCLRSSKQRVGCILWLKWEVDLTCTGTLVFFHLSLPFLGLILKILV